ncbi:MAG TPA: 2-oxoglutarate dehydrogenase E1 component [Chloroflexota bacterium]|nr:2-oxoglutarate dehydrogenase E1 component [Chloroflexota bacterium]
MSVSRAGWASLTGPNEAYLREQYEHFLRDPESIDAATRDFLRLAGPPPPDGASAVPASAAGDEPAAHLIAAVGELATAIRDYGHLASRLDPLGSDPPGDPELDPATHGLSETLLERLPAAAVKGPAAEGRRSAKEAIDALRQIYCGTTAYDYDQVQEIEERNWLRDAAEARRFSPPHDEINPHAILERLTEVGAFERFLNRTFPGQTRFSIEGTGMLIPMLDEVIGAAAEEGIRSVLIGMAHRGRLNVLTHVLGKPVVEVFEEFKKPAPRKELATSSEAGGEFSGDVKYHLGHRRAVRTGEEVTMQVTLAPTPSHLEFVNPVVEGMARAAGERRDQPGAASVDVEITLPVLIHGDAAFPGQGVVAETLNLSRLPGYTTGGTIHIIVNNQLGFTVEPYNGRSTLYASDLAKGFEIPIVHVNADDPEACIAAARLAHSYRETFHKDFLIDLIGYRRWGHNEGDDPSMTQPLMYAKIAEHPTVRELWAREMVSRNLITQEDVDNLLKTRTTALQQALEEVNQRLAGEVAGEANGSAGRSTERSVPQQEGAGQPVEITTGLSLTQLAALNGPLYALPEGFAPHPRVERLTLAPRRAATNENKPIDWGHAESLALAAILSEATPIRLTGQDAQRGTFGQRHAVLHDAKSGHTHVPLRHHPLARAAFELYDSPLSESACIGFEFGYSVQAPETLVLWEAQYGDFVNGAQVVLDQFLVSARAKWGQEASLVLLLPHGYEGQGPEHSSARLERFLEQAAEGNIRIANCTTAAQYFHLLRRQARLLAELPRPLVVMTPKSLLRHPLAASPLSDFAEGTGFRAVLDDPFFSGDQSGRSNVQRVVLCSGKVYVDLAASEARKSADGVALVRVEQLYRFPAEAIERVLALYPRADDVVWLQEEPRNMGAWTFVAPRLQPLLNQRGARMRYVGRPERASPSEGTPAWHAVEQARIVAEAFEGLTDAATVSVAVAKGKSDG